MNSPLQESIGVSMLAELREEQSMWSQKSRRQYSSSYRALSQSKLQLSPNDKLEEIYRAAEGKPLSFRDVKSCRKDATAAILHGSVRISVNGRQSRGLTGIIDTGAEVSVIPVVLMQAWGLKPDTIRAFTMAGGATQNLGCYSVSVSIPDVNPKELCLPAVDRDTVLIGQDLMAGCQLTIDYDNKYCALYQSNMMRRCFGRIRHVINSARDFLFCRG